MGENKKQKTRGYIGHNYMGENKKTRGYVGCLEICVSGANCGRKVSSVHGTQWLPLIGTALYLK